VIVACPDRWLSEYRELLESLGISDRIIHLSGLSDVEMSYVYRHATALFLLSEYEGFGFPPLEAMLAGTPAVVSDSTSLGEIVGDAALRIKAHDIDGAAEAMRSLSTNAQLRQQFQKAGKAKASTYTWSKTAGAFSAILSELAVTKPNSAKIRELSR